MVGAVDRTWSEETVNVERKRDTGTLERVQSSISKSSQVVTARLRSDASVE